MSLITDFTIVNTDHTEIDIHAGETITHSIDIYPATRKLLKCVVGIAFVKLDILPLQGSQQKLEVRLNRKSWVFAGNMTAQDKDFFLRFAATNAFANTDLHRSHTLEIHSEGIQGTIDLLIERYETVQGYEV